MTRRRWIADQVSGDHAVLSGDHAHHLVKVLRAEIGQEFDIATGSDVRRGRISAVHPDRVEFDLGETILQGPPGLISVAVSIFKFDRLEWAIEKVTELGVASIIPVISARTESHLVKAATKRRERWQRIATQASEQARRSAVPDIAEPTKIKDLLGMKSDVRIVLSESEQERMLIDVVRGGPRSLLLAFGPEGGWKEEELKVFREADWLSASLGPSILRTETAVIAALAVCQAILFGSGR
jgi:16S rRNA (uracil1498-N3)-methyltransferase